MLTACFSHAIGALLFLSGLARADTTRNRRPIGPGRPTNKLAGPLAPVGISLTVLLTACIFAASVRSRADTVTLSVSPTYNQGSSKSFNVPTNAVAQILYSSLVNIGNNTPPTIKSYYTVEINSNTVPGRIGLIFVGPATITLVSTNMGAPTILQTISFVTIQTSPATTFGSFTPSSSVVIPNDGGGPVTIILESSVDLANWTAALPGTYGTTTSSRFFRVRAQR